MAAICKSRAVCSDAGRSHRMHRRRCQAGGTPVLQKHKGRHRQGADIGDG